MNVNHSVESENDDFDEQKPEGEEPSMGKVGGIEIRQWMMQWSQKHRQPVSAFQFLLIEFLHKGLEFFSFKDQEKKSIRQPRFTRNFHFFLDPQTD